MKGQVTFLVLLVLQLICVAVFTYDIGANLLGLRVAPVNWQLYELVQVGAAFFLIGGIFLSARMLRQSLSRQKVAEDNLRMASGAFMDVLQERFVEWILTPAERDVALFLIKGLSTAEIAALRDTSEGTVKAQTNAIYRKANVTGRPQLLSLFIDELMDVEGGVAGA